MSQGKIKITTETETKEVSVAVNNETPEIEITAESVPEVIVLGSAQVGPQGPPGPSGPPGETIIDGYEPPDADFGKVGDYYIDLNAHRLYGPKQTLALGPPHSGYGNVAPTSWYGSGVLSTGNILTILENAQIVAIRFYRNAAEVSTSRSLRLYRQAVLLVELMTADEPPTSGWIELPLSTPISVLAGEQVMPVVDRSQGYVYGTNKETNDPNIRWDQSAFSPELGVFPTTNGGDYTYATDVVVRAVADSPWPLALQGA